MCNAEANTKTVKKVKDAVDFIFEATQGNGTAGGWQKYPARVRASVSIMIQRGILVKEGHPKSPIYRWAASMAPTKNLYQSIANEIVTRERASNQRHREKKRASGWRVTPQPQTQNVARENPEVKNDPTIVPAIPAAPAVTAAPSMAQFSDQELWDELKRRGYEAEDSQIVFKKYLN